MEFTEKNIYNAIKNIAQWDVLGINLGFNSDELSIIKKDTNDINGAIIRLIGEWIRSDKEANWKRLAGALQLMGRKRLADSLYREDCTDVSSSAVATVDMRNPNKEVNSLMRTGNIDELTLSSSSKRNIEQNILRLEKRFGFIVKDTKKDIFNDEQKIRELPDIIEFGLPERLKGLRNFVTYSTLTRDNFHFFFQALECMWSFIDYDLLRTIIYIFENIDLMNKIDVYIKDVEKFCAETTIQDFIEIWKPRYDYEKIPEELIICVTELSIDFKTSKVKELKEIQHKLKGFFPKELAMAAFYIYNVRPGSVKVSWLVWAKCHLDLTNNLKNLLQSDSNFVAEVHLSYMSLDDDILYSTYNDQVLVQNNDFTRIENIIKFWRICHLANN